MTGAGVMTPEMRMHAVPGADLPGADRRYRYVPFARLSWAHQLTVRSAYRHSDPHLPDTEYWYPVRKDGTPAHARRWIPGERAKELWEEHVARGILES